MQLKNAHFMLGQSYFSFCCSVLSRFAFSNDNSLIYIHIRCVY